MIRKGFLLWRDSFRGIPRNVWLLSFVSLVNRCGGMVIAFMTLYLTQHLKYEIREAGYVMSCFGIGAIAGAYSGGWLTDKVGFHRVQFWSLVANALILFVLVEVHNFWLMCLTVGVWSFIGEVFRPANTVAIIRNSSAETRTRSFSLMRMSFNLGWTLAPTLGGFIAYNFGWAWLFWIDGATCLAAALLLEYLLGGQKNDFKKREILDAPLPDAAEKSAAVEDEVLQKTSPLRDRNYVSFLLLTMVGAIVFMQILWTVPVFFKEIYGWNEAKIGWVSAINGALVVLIEMPLIFKIEQKRRRLTWVRLGLVLYALAYFSFVVPTAWAMTAAMLFMLAISLGEIFVMPFSSSWVSLRAGEQSQGRYMAYYTMAYSISNVLAPMLGTQVIAAWGYHALWYILVAFSAVAWTGIYFLEKKEVQNLALQNLQTSEVA